MRHVTLCLAVSAFFFNFASSLCRQHPNVTYNIINVLLLLCVSLSAKPYGMAVSLRNMRVFVLLGTVCSYIGTNAVQCYYTDNVRCMDNVQKLNFAFDS